MLGAIAAIALAVGTVSATASVTEDHHPIQSQATQVVATKVGHPNENQATQVVVRKEVEDSNLVFE